jgi:hypothetical protein
MPWTAPPNGITMYQNGAVISKRHRILEFSNGPLVATSGLYQHLKFTSAFLRTADIGTFALRME